MKILVVSAFPPDPAPEAAHALHISEHLAASGHAVHVVCKEGSLASVRDGIIVHPIMRRWDWSDLPRLIRRLRDCQPDIVFLIYVDWVFKREPLITFLPTICKTVLPQTPCVTQFENVAQNASRRSVLARILRKVAVIWAGRRDVHWALGTLLRDSAHVIFLSSPHRTGAMRVYPDVDEKSTILPPPPLMRMCSEEPAVARQRARHALGLKPHHFAWVYWGYIYTGKGIETLLRAFHAASQRNPDLRLVLVGGVLDVPTDGMNSNDYFRMVQRLSDVLGVADQVSWTGGFAWDSEAGSFYLHAADACVLPMDWGVTLNNSSLAAAATHGLPVIGTELPQGRDEMLAHGQNVILVRPRDPEMLAEAMELITESAELRERLRGGIRKLADRWHRWDAMTKRLTAILQSTASVGSEPAGRQARIETNDLPGFCRKASNAAATSST